LDSLNSKLNISFLKVINHFLVAVFQRFYYGDFLLHLNDSKEVNQSIKRSYYYKKYDYDNLDLYSGKNLEESFGFIDEF